MSSRSSLIDSGGNPPHPKTAPESFHSALLALLPLRRMEGVGGIGILDLLQNTNISPPLARIPIENSELTRPGARRQLDRHLFEFHSLTQLEQKSRHLVQRDS